MLTVDIACSICAIYTPIQQTPRARSQPPLHPQCAGRSPAAHPLPDSFPRTNQQPPNHPPPTRTADMLPQHTPVFQARTFFSTISTSSAQPMRKLRFLFLARLGTAILFWSHSLAVRPAHFAQRARPHKGGADLIWANIVARHLGRLVGPDHPAPTPIRHSTVSPQAQHQHPSRARRWLSPAAHAPCASAAVQA
eukprot:1405950-Rhodomonas_salina.3